MQDEASTPLQEFIWSLTQAYAASRDCDAFDLHSDDPTSLAEWQRRRREQARSFMALVTCVTTHQQELLCQFRKEIHGEGDV